MARGYDRLRARIKTRSREVVEEAAALMGQALDRDVPVATGKLRDSQVISVSDTEDRVSVSITYTEPYWRVTTEGSPAHRIVPKNHPVLYFFWDNAPEEGTYHRGTFDGPGYYDFDYVNHPGQKGTNWYGKTVNSATWSEKLYEASQGNTRSSGRE